MKELVSLINITEDSDIEGVIDQLMKELEQFNATRAVKHSPEGDEHDGNPE